MGSCQAKLPRGRFVESIPRGDGGHEAKGSKFIGSEKLFRQIDQNEFLILFSSLMQQRQRIERGQILEPPRRFN